MHLDLRSFIDALRNSGELVEIDAPVDPRLEIAEIHRRVIAAGGPALLFRNPKGHSTPVVTNLFGTTRRVEQAFGRSPIDFVEKAVQLVHEIVPPTASKLWSERSFFSRAMKLGTRRVRRGPVGDVVQSPPRLTDIPMLHSWPEDGGAFVTLPLVYTEHPNDGTHNLGMYRIQRYDDATTGMHWQIGRGGGFHHAVAQHRDQALPATVFVGGPPSLMLSAVAPLPENVPELVLASLLMGGRIPTIDNPTSHPHRLLASCEFAIMGHVPAHETRPEGPFGDHYGYYSLTHDYPVLHVDAVARRSDAIWPATVVGKPRQEDLFIGDYLQTLLSPLFPLVMPNVVDLWSYGETGYHALASAVIKQRYRREAMAGAFRILGEGHLSFTKFLWVLDDSVDLKDPRVVLPHLLARFRPETDLYVFSNLSMDSLDYAGPEVNLGSKGIMLGVGEPWRDLPTSIPSSIPGVVDAKLFCPGCLVVQGAPHEEDPDLCQTVVEALHDWPLVVLVDDAQQATRTASRFLWTTFTRFEPAADMVASRTRVERHHIVYGGCIGIDARMKPSYPDELFCDPDTAKRVSERWNAYFPESNVEMGDSDAGHLDFDA